MTNGFPKTLIIIPAFNEEANIGRLLNALKKDVPEADILVVNDGSSDSTAELGAAAGVKVLSHPYNMGIGATVQTGYKYASRNGYEIAVQVDGDGQHPPDQIRHLLVPLIEDRADIVIGSRFLGAGDYRPSAARAAGITVFAKVVSAIVGKRLTDTTSGFRAAGRRCMEYLSFSYPDDYPEVESIVLLHKAGFRIMEVPVRMVERAGGRSSITPLKSAYYMVKVLLAICVDLLKKTERAPV